MAIWSVLSIQKKSILKLLIRFDEKNYIYIITFLVVVSELCLLSC